MEYNTNCGCDKKKNQDKETFIRFQNGTIYLVFAEAGGGGLVGGEAIALNYFSLAPKSDLKSQITSHK